MNINGPDWTAAFASAVLDVGVRLLARADAVEPILDLAFGDPPVAFPCLGQLGIGRVLNEVWRVCREVAAVDFDFAVFAHENMSMEIPE